MSIHLLSPVPGNYKQGNGTRLPDPGLYAAEAEGSLPWAKNADSTNLKLNCMIDAFTTMFKEQESQAEQSNRIERKLDKIEHALASGGYVKPTMNLFA